jgi:hypothetical protein
MKTTTLTALACALIAPLAFAQTIITRELITTQTIATLDSTHVMSVNNIAPGEKIVVQTSPDTQPVTVALDKGVTYVTATGRPIDPSSIRPGSRVRLEFAGAGPGRGVTRVVMVNP